MMAQDLIERAQALCRHRGIRFPADLLQYAHQWQRERFDLEFCWRHVKPLLSSNLPLWQAEVEVRRHHDRLQRDSDAQSVKAGEPLDTLLRQARSAGGTPRAPRRMCSHPPRFWMIRETSARARSRGKRPDRDGSHIGSAPALRHTRSANC
jgi:hypothetical protein